MCGDDQVGVVTALSEGTILDVEDINEPNKTKTSEDALRSDHQTHQLLQQGIRDRAGALNHLMTNKRDN